MATEAPLARWKDLCLDALDQTLIGEFWASALAMTTERSPGKFSIEGDRPEHRIWVNRVERPRVVKNRIHLDIDADAVADLEALGATMIAPAEQTGLGWHVMADPEGGEFCAFLRDPDRPRRYPLHGLVIDCHDTQAQAAWWGRVLGLAPIAYSGGRVFSLEGATGERLPTLDFVPGPEPKAAPNRVHWDVLVDSDGVERLLAAGATFQWETSGWTVLADPEGNEFCAMPNNSRRLGG